MSKTMMNISQKSRGLDWHVTAPEHKSQVSPDEHTSIGVTILENKAYTFWLH